MTHQNISGNHRRTMLVKTLPSRSRVAVATALLALATSQTTWANGVIQSGAGASACTDCHAGTSFNYADLYLQIQALAKTGAGNDAWIAAIKACGSGVLGKTGTCASSPPAPINQAPAVSVTSPSAVVEPAVVTFSVTATDPDGDTVTVAASGDVNGTPAANLYDDATHTFKWEPSVAGSYSVTFTPTDGKGLAGAAATVQITVDKASSSAGNDAPVITKPIDGSTVNVTKGTPVSIPVAATDKNGDTVKLSFTGSDGSSGSVPASFDAVSGAWSGNLEWTPTATSPSTVTFKITATDAPDDTAITPKSSSVSMTVKVNDGPSTGSDISAVNITRAIWSKRGGKLAVYGHVTVAKGVKTRGKQVTITNADSGEVIGSATIKRRNAWVLVARVSSAVCSITASVDGVTATQDVSRGCAAGSNSGSGSSHHGKSDDDRKTEKHDD